MGCPGYPLLHNVASHDPSCDRCYKIIKKPAVGSGFYGQRDRCLHESKEYNDKAND
jgi:hypothetical protein